MSTDTSLSLLFPAIQAQNSPALWVIDEHGAGSALPVANSWVSVISNRLDVANQLRKQGWNTTFNDMAFESSEALDCIFFRLAKEKPVVHHIINLATRQLAIGGRLIISGTKQQGIKTYAKHAAEALGGPLEIKKHGNDYLAVIIRGETAGDALDDKDYPTLRPIYTLNERPILSKPGLYGWDKIDNGSAMLIDLLPEIIGSRKPERILDLGCGYGFLSLMAHQQFPDATITATDNNAAAVIACQANFTEHGVAGEVSADDCGTHVRGSYHLILCNPPFHQGFDVERDLTALFVETARRLCHSKKGLAVFVVNTFIPIERIASGRFPHVNIVANNGRFKVVALRP